MLVLAGAAAQKAGLGVGNGLRGGGEYSPAARPALGAARAASASTATRSTRRAATTRLSAAVSGFGLLGLDGSCGGGGGGTAAAVGVNESPVGGAKLGSYERLLTCDACEIAPGSVGAGDGVCVGGSLGEGRLRLSEGELVVAGHPKGVETLQGTREVLDDLS